MKSTQVYGDNSEFQIYNKVSQGKSDWSSKVSPELEIEDISLDAKQQVLDGRYTFFFVDYFFFPSLNNLKGCRLYIFFFLLLKVWNQKKKGNIVKIWSLVKKVLLFQLCSDQESSQSVHK